MEADYPEVPIQMTKLFHALDREFYITLVFRLQCDPWVSALTIAFWIWLEHLTFENVVTKILSSSLEMINGLFEEAVVCLGCIANTMRLFPHTSCELSLTQDLLGQHLCFVYLYENRAVAFDEINKVAGGVCMKALNDLMEMATNRNTQQHFVQMPTIKAPRERRTMFATFSKGHPVYEWEIRQFFSKIFGDCIDSITMQPVRPHQQPLYALIVFTTPGILDFISMAPQKQNSPFMEDRFGCASLSQNLNNPSLSQVLQHLPRMCFFNCFILFYFLLSEARSSWHFLVSVSSL